MEKFVPYDKFSKKEKRRLDNQRRGTWGEINPATRKPENSKAYHRSKARNWKHEYHEPVPGILFAFFLVSVIIQGKAGDSQQRKQGHYVSK